MNGNGTETKLIACRVIVEEIKSGLAPEVECITMDTGLHFQPETMRESLQTVIDEHTQNGETVILGYGLCSMGVLGLRVNRGTLVIPRAHDCVAVLLGSDRTYRTVTSREPGTYFLSRGWIDAKITLLDELQAMEKKYGKTTARRIMDTMLNHYTRLVYIRMDHPEEDEYERTARRVAAEFGLRFERMKGNLSLLESIAAGKWDNRFIVARRGKTITLSDFNVPPIRSAGVSSA